MTEPLSIVRADKTRLTVTKVDDRYEITTNSTRPINQAEYDQIAAYIGDDPDGARTLEKLRAKL